MSVATPTGTVTSAFPKTQTEACLRDELLHVAEAATALSGVTLPSSLTARFAAQIQIDSLIVVELLCALDSILGFQLKDNVVRAGGYKSIDEAVAHLMPRIESAWNKHHGKGGKK